MEEKNLYKKNREKERNGKRTILSERGKGWGVGES